MTSVKTRAFVETIVWTVGRPNGSSYEVRCVVLGLDSESLSMHAE